MNVTWGRSPCKSGWYTVVCSYDPQDNLFYWTAYWDAVICEWDVELPVMGYIGPYDNERYAQAIMDNI